MSHPVTKLSNRRGIAVGAGVVVLLLVVGFLILDSDEPPNPILGIHAGSPPTGVPWTMHTIDDAQRGPDGVKLADANHDGLPDIATGWERAGLTRVYLHPGFDRVRERWPAVTVGVTAEAEDAVLVDLDGDGALDVVTSTEGEERHLYVHWSPKNTADLLEPSAWKQETFPAVDQRTQWMFAQPFDIDRRHGIDLVIGGKNDDRAVPSMIGWLESPPNPRDTAAWRWHPLREDVGWVMSIIAEDMNSDGHVDVLYTDKHGPRAGIYWLENPGREDLVDGPWKQHSIAADGLTQTSFATVADLDEDGQRDIVGSVTLPTGQPGITKSTAGVDNTTAESDNLVFLRRLDASGDRWESYLIPAPANTGWPKSVSVGDVDLDGRLDLVVSTSAAVDALIGVYWLSRVADRLDSPWDAHDISGPVGTKYDLVPLVDLDGDGDLDALSTEEKESDKNGLGVIWYENPTRPIATVSATASAAGTATATATATSASASATASATATAAPADAASTN